MVGSQPDLFSVEASTLPSQLKATSADKVTPPNTFVPEAGHPYYKAAQELIHYVNYINLNDWQKKILWPWMKEYLRNIKDHPHETIHDVNQLSFELGFLVAAIELELLRPRSEALAIIHRYGINLK